MTEIGDLGALFGRQPPQPSPEQAAHAEAMHAAQAAAEMLAYAQVQFFAPVLCGCEPRFTWGEPRPPQLGCVVHGHLQLSHDGRILMFGIPEKW